MTALDRRYDTQIHRRMTRTVMVGDVPLGSEHPIVVQSMICLLYTSDAADDA